LRNALARACEARFQRYFAAIERIESDAIDFKIELRRSIHLALWHAMSACDEAGTRSVSAVPGQPDAGSCQSHAAARMAASGRCLASIQIRLLSGPRPASALAQETTRQLFAALRQNLPANIIRRCSPIPGRRSWPGSRHNARN
jgi:hypothetical protein